MYNFEETIFLFLFWGKGTTFSKKFVLIKS